MPTCAKALLRALLIPLLIAPSVSLAEPKTADIKIERSPFSSYLPPDQLTVVVAFDGSKSSRKWAEILKFSDEQNIRCTFFISSVYFLPDSDRKLYARPPDMKRHGYSAIGFGGTKEAVEERKKWVLKAIDLGHDIESHLDGHEDGANWPESAWAGEFSQFPILCKFLPAAVKHIRFPHLAMNSAVYPVLAKSGIHSITSVGAARVSDFSQVTVTQDGQPYTILEFPMDYVLMHKRYVCLMDYNFYAMDLLQKRVGKAAKDHMVECYKQQAAICFREHRPLFLSHHFSDWNQGAYWQALQETIVYLKKTYQTQFLTIDQLYTTLSAPPQYAKVGGKIVTPSVPAFSLPDYWPEDQAQVYHGIIWKHIPIYLKLKRNGLQIQGTVFYKRYGPDINVKGAIDPDGKFTLFEMNDRGEYVGMLQGKFTKHGHIEGRWSKPNGSVPRAFQFDQAKNVLEYDHIQAAALERSHMLNKPMVLPVVTAPETLP